ncbi:MAG: hypothetical protein WA125_17615 [Desulfosporosinus sp.]
MCDGYYWLDEQRKAQVAYEKRKEFRDNRDNLVWLIQGESVVFYKAFSKDNCLGCTSWCMKHCYMNNRDFIPKLRKKINKSQEMPICSYWDLSSNSSDEKSSIDFDEKYLPLFHEDIQKTKYVTFFGSGSINCEEDVKFIKWIIKNYPDKHYRIFIRDFYKIEEFYGQQIIFSADKDTDKNLLERALKDKNVNIAVLYHPDNMSLITELIVKIKTILVCDECLENGCTKHLCFKEDNKFFLIENYEEPNKKEE